MSAWTSSERFWIDVNNIGLGLLVAVPVILTALAIFSEWVTGRKRRHLS